MACDKKFQNVLLLSLGSLLLIAADQTTIMIQKTVMESIAAADSDFTADGYTSLGIVYAFFALGSWFAPSIISLLTPKWSIVLSVVPYILFMAAYLKPITWVLYFLSGVLGLGSGLFWAGQGTMLSICSDEDTIVRNSGIFRAVIPLSLLVGNLLVLFAFEGQTLVYTSTRIMVFSVLMGFGATGMVIFLFLRNAEDFDDTREGKKTNDPQSSTSGTSSSRTKDPPSQDPSTLKGAKQAADLKVSSNKAVDGAFGKKNESEDQEGPVQAFLGSLKLLQEVDMALLCFSFICLGFSESFCYGVYSAAVGFTLRFGEGTARYVGISGILFGAGGTAGGLFVSFLGKKIKSKGRCCVMISGAALVILACTLIFLNLPDDSVFGPTEEDGLIQSNLALALSCSVVLGIGDSFIQSLVCATLGSKYADRSAQAFAIFKFCQMLASAVAFFYSAYVGLRGQVAIFASSCVAASVTFCIVTRRADRQFTT